MKRSIFVLLACLWATGLGAQSAPTLSWTHDGANVTHFECWLDGTYGGSLGKPTPTGQTYTALLSLCGTITTGQHTLLVKACNNSLCADGTRIYVVKL